MTDLDPSSATSITGVLGGAIAIAVVWGGKIMAKRLGLETVTAGEANAQAQKDMLDWQRDQLKEEVARRKEAELQAQSLLEKLNDFVMKMGHMEQQNARLQEQMEFMTNQNNKLQDKIQTLTLTVEQLKSNMLGVTIA